LYHIAIKGNFSLAPWGEGVRRTGEGLLVLLFGLLLFSSCSTDDFEYENKYRCYFTFDCGIHQGTVLQNCLNPVSPGLFCMVWKQNVGATRHIQMQLCNKKTDDVAITTASEVRTVCELGANNGLVIGCSTLNNGQLYAFDRICPNCDKANGIKVALQWENNGLWLKCPKCERVYDLNNNGFIVKGESGDKLMRYRASYDGKVLLITN
jgi:nitrite reductase/ring-hydroxylating ferredoxin subunit